MKEARSVLHLLGVRNLLSLLLALALLGCRGPHHDAAPPPSSGAALALGAPVASHARPTTTIVRPQYAVAVNASTHIADWVSWRLVATDVGATPRHVGAFLTDTSLPRGFYQVTHADYSRSGYDRGHLCPSQDRTSSTADNDATFFLTNVTPQTHELNAGPWEALEKYSRRLARQGKDLYITAGPIFAGTPATIGHGVAVPSAFYKVVVVLEHGQSVADVTAATTVLSVVMPNSHDVAADWHGYQVTLLQAEHAAGYRFLTGLAEPLHAALTR